MALVRPHGGSGLQPLMLEGRELAAERKRAGTLAGVRVSSREKGDIVMLGIGGFTPLELDQAASTGARSGTPTCRGRAFWPPPAPRWRP